jgi:EmrB/QacA subfamily drug resistance transporter
VTSTQSDAASSASPRTDREREALTDGIDVQTYRRRWATLFVLCLALSATMLANTSLSVALPYLSRDLGASTSAQQWFSNAYALVFAGLLFTTSALADRYGRKTTLQTGLVIFGAVSLYVTLFVDSSLELIVARGLLGFGAAMIMPVTLSILTSVFPSSERTRAVGVWAAVSGAGSALGPVLAGVLIEYYSWESVFAINVPVVVAAVIAGIRFVPSHHDGAGGHGGIDLGGAVLSTAGVTLVVYALIEAQHVGWTAPRTLLMVALGLVLVAAFVAWELRVEDPMLDVRLFSNSAFSASALALTLVFFALIGVFFSLSQTLQLVYGYSPISSSVSMLPMSIVMMIVAPQVARIVGRFGPRATIAGGLVLAATGMAGLSTLTAESGYWHLLIPLSVTAVGMSLTMAPATDQLMANVPRARAGMGSATNDVTREVGASLGIAVLGSVLGGGYAARLNGSVEGLPQQVRDAAESSLAGGLQVAASAGARGGALAHDVVTAWMGGLQVAHLAGAGLILLAAVISWVWLPRRAQPDEDEAHHENSAVSATS